MAWTNLSFPFGSVLTSTQMTQMDDNFDALAAGSAGAPPIQTAAIVAGERMNTTNVLAATAGAAVGAVGTYAFLGETTATITSYGATRAGSNLRYAGIAGSPAWNTTGVGIFGAAINVAPAGTWRCMGYSYGDSTPNYGATLWLRIS